ncbi:MAG TPA: CBM20 domain-containing protein [Candidatus Eremiobacteraceae bacterium]|nr:CBM20 domain-containing protein [Candidatus Eremiobacteraceae bacterium]
MSRRVATSIIAVAAFTMCISATAAATDATSQTALSGIFVSLGADSNGTLLTIERDGSLRAVRVAADAAVTEAEAGSEPQAATLSKLMPGEPVDLSLNASGVVTSILARFATVTTQVIAAQNGYLVCADGNAYKLVGSATAAIASLHTGIYVLMRTDSTSGSAFDVVASRTPFRGIPSQAASVAVTFIVAVPPNTPPGDTVYLATNASSWTPNGVRMTPLSGGRFTVVMQLAPGTQIEYRYTRGSWSTDERTAAGTPTPNRSLAVQRSGAAQTVTDVVARWADLNS